MSDKTDEAIGRMRKWLWDSGDLSKPQFVADLKTLIQAAQNEQRQELVRRQNEQRQELVRRFAVAMVGTEWCYNPGARDFTPDKVWEWAKKLADAEPSSNP